MNKGNICNNTPVMSIQQLLVPLESFVSFPVSFSLLLQHLSPKRKGFGLNEMDCVYLALSYFIPETLIHHH